MNQVLPYPETFVKETLHVPSVCLVLPFEPQLNDKGTISRRLKALVAKAEARLLQQYSTHKAMPVLSRLQQQIAGINYYNFKKSLAILASPFSSKIFYLDFPVRETVRTGELLDIRQVLKAKCEEVRYLALVLESNSATLYRGNSIGITCIQHNKVVPDPASGNSRFLHKLDQGLKLVLQAYPLPVFVLGREALLDQFRQLTVHDEAVIGYIPGTFEGHQGETILLMLQPHLDQWGMLKHAYLAKQLQAAGRAGQLSCGIDAVWNAATHRRSALLVVEDNFTTTEKVIPEQEKVAPLAPDIDESVYLNDLADDAIEKVLKDCGNVELVPPGTLGAFQHIALVTQNETIPSRYEKDTCCL